MSILVTGGAGYIGSHVTYALLDRGENVVVLDNLSTGVRELVADSAVFVEGNVGDKSLVNDTIERYCIDTVIHFAGSVVVPESVTRPLDYYANNVVASRNLIESTIHAGVKHFIFSSTAAVYGETDGELVNEAHAPQPQNPYGRSKLMVEWILQDAAKASSLNYTILRYFNVAGADPKGRTGQATPRATHLIKRACQVALGLQPELCIFGTDFPTPDGTGVRDYIHVADLANAHLLALESSRNQGAAHVLNCGYGHGYSVKQVVHTLEKLTGSPLTVSEAGRRAGDAASVIADPARLKERLHWQPQYDSLDTIVRSAYAWEAAMVNAGKVARVSGSDELTI